MLTFLQPIWLWAAAAVIAPVLIHLWNIKQGKTLKVGSIALFAKSAASHTRSLRIKDWLLLLLRCMLIIMLAMLIANPLWKQENTLKDKGWILIEKGNMREAYGMYRAMIDTLLQQGYAIHYFSENFEKGSLKDTASTGAEVAKDSALLYWTLLKLLNQKLPAGFPLRLFTGNNLLRFAGSRPATSLQLGWYIVPKKDTSATWLQEAHLTATDSIRIVKGESHPGGTFYTHQNLSLNSNNSLYKISNQSGNIMVADSTGQTVMVDTTTTNIAIYANGFADDANYLKAALTAITNVTERRMKITLVDKKEKIPPEADWVFWLSDEALPLLKQNTRLFIYEKGETKNIHSWLLTDNEAAVTTTQNIPLYKYIKSKAFSFQTIWKNGYGEPLLAKQNNNGSIYHFYSRFSPQWSDLVWNARFPQLLYDVIFDKSGGTDANQKKEERIIDSSQIQPQFVSGKYIAAEADSSTETDLSVWLWMTSFLLFFAERILSFRKQRAQQA